MLCRACGELGPSPCPACARTLLPAPDAVLGSLLVRSAFLHEGAGRALVRRLKYHGESAVVPALADAMAPLVPTDGRVLVPVPRSLGRRVRYGIDQAVVLAEALGDRTGLPVVHALAADLLHRPNAGRRRVDRRPPRFGPRRTARGVVLVDDVLTTGATILAASAVEGVGVIGAVTATRSTIRIH